MRVFYSEKHKLRDAKTELHGGLLVKPFEGPFRAEWVLAGVKEAGFTDVRAPAEHGLETALKVHDAGYLEFLRTCWDRCPGLYFIFWIWHVARKLGTEPRFSFYRFCRYFAKQALELLQDAERKGEAGTSNR